MELIPILATIILMATISTFFLAIGAYVLYKIRERRGSKPAVEIQQNIQAELITPEVMQEAAPQQEALPQLQQAPMFERPVVPQYRPAPEPIFMSRKQSAPVMQPVAAPVAAPEPGVARAEIAKAGPAPAPSTGQSKTGQQEKKFMRFTAEGMVTAREEKKNGSSVKWR